MPRYITRSIILLLILTVLVSCGSTNVTPDEQEGRKTQMPDQPTLPPQTKETFDGVVGQDWFEIVVPLFEEIGGATDIVYGAKKLWVIDTRVDATVASSATPGLLSSVDGIKWERVDLDALGFIKELQGNARLLGTEDTIYVIVENGATGYAITGERTKYPWILKGDGEQYEKISLPLPAGEWRYVSITGSESGYFVFDKTYRSYKDLRVIHSVEGKSWTEFTPLLLHSKNLNNEWFKSVDKSMLMYQMRSVENGLVALGGLGHYRHKSILYSGPLPFDYLNPKGEE